MKDIRIFLFHRIAEKRNNWPYATETSIFDKCVSYITKNFTVKPVEECIALPEKEIKKLSKPLAAITFDDGFKDNIKYALPILEKYKCPASFYLVTDCIDNDTPTWPHLFQYLFQNTNKLDLRINLQEMGMGITEKKFLSKTERIKFGDKLLQKLFTLSSDKANQVLDKIGGYYNDIPKPENLMMNWNEVKQLSSGGYNIGSHTCTHPLLTYMDSDDSVRYEFMHSAERIKEVCGKPVETIAYPLGVANERIMKLAKECGYKYGLTVEQRIYRHSVDTIMAVPRTDIFAGSGWIKTYLRLTGDLEKIKKMVGR